MTFVIEPAEKNFNHTTVHIHFCVVSILPHEAK